MTIGLPDSWLEGVFPLKDDVADDIPLSLFSGEMIWGCARKFCDPCGCSLCFDFDLLDRSLWSRPKLDPDIGAPECLKAS